MGNRKTQSPPDPGPDVQRKELGRIPLVRTPRKGIAPVADEAAAPPSAPEPAAAVPPPSEETPQPVRRKDRRNRVFG